MSKTDLYYTVPLSILRSQSDPVEVLSACISVGTVNAGLGYRKTHDAEDVELLWADADYAAEDGQPTEPPANLTLLRPDGTKLTGPEAAVVWGDAFIGRQILGYKGGCRTVDAQKWLTLHQPGEVFFKIRSDLLWNAVLTARREAGAQVTGTFDPLSFREFRILAAILSAPVNRHGFVFLGWESIQARSCGFVRKADFAAQRQTLPEHCPVLSRKMIRYTTERMEGLKFFARFRYAAGKSGGKFAYSFRHPTREALADSVCQWLAHRRSLQVQVIAHRATDRDLSARLKQSALTLAMAGPR